MSNPNRDRVQAVAAFLVFLIVLALLATHFIVEPFHLSIIEEAISALVMASPLLALLVIVGLIST
jgi:hypothetical protein